MIKPDDKVTLTVMNHIIEVQHLEKMNTKIHIKKLDKNRYMVIDTGEIREFEQSEKPSLGVSMRSPLKPKLPKNERNAASLIFLSAIRDNCNIGLALPSKASI